MKKLILMAMVIMVLAAGCGNKITEADVMGYWMDENNNLHKFGEDGVWYIYVGSYELAIGMVMCLDDEVAITMNGAYRDEGVSATATCEFSDDKKVLTYTVNGESATMKRVTTEQAAAMGVVVE